MNKINLIIALLFLNLLSTAQVVSIPDTIFLQSLIAAKVDLNKDKLIQHSEATAVTNLSLYQKAITNFQGIEAFTSLTELNMYYVPNKNLSLTNNKALQKVTFGNCGLNSIDLSECKALKILSLNYNQIIRLDVSNNTELEELSCFSNQIDSLDLRNNIKLKTLHCSKNNLKTLDLGYSPFITDIGAGENKLTKIDLSKNTELVNLSLDRGTLEEINLTTNAKLQKLYISQNKLKNLDVSQNKLLTHLLASENLLESLDLRQNPLLNTVSCSSNPYLYTICISIKHYPSGNWFKDGQARWNNNCAVTGLEKESEVSNTSIKNYKVFNILGQELGQNNSGLLIYKYNDGSVRKLLVE